MLTSAIENQTERSKKAQQNFLSGLNCAQSIFDAFSDITGLDKKIARKMSSGFGGGMGRLREVCGAFSGVVMTLSWLYGYDEHNDEDKMRLYSYVQECAHKFEEKYGTVVCHELLGLEKGENNSFVPTPRTNEFYKKRPCTDYIGYCAQILDEFIASHPID